MPQISTGFNYTSKQLLRQYDFKFVLSQIKKKLPTWTVFTFNHKIMEIIISSNWISKTVFSFLKKTKHIFIKPNFWNRKDTIHCQFINNASNADLFNHYLRENSICYMCGCVSKMFIIISLFVRIMIFIQPISNLQLNIPIPLTWHIETEVPLITKM